MSLQQRQTQSRRSRSRSAVVHRRTDIIEHIAKDDKNNGNKYSYLDLVDQLGFAPLHKAVVMKQYTTLQQLISKGVDVNKKTCNGMTALLLASRHGDVSAVQILLASDSCNLDAQDKTGWTALHHCAINNHLLIAEMLLIAGADPHTASMERNSPRDVAPVNDMKNLLTRFLEREVNPSHFINNGMTKKCLVVPRKGCTLRSEELGLGMEVSRSAIDGNVFFICNRISATCSRVELGQSEVLISDIYEFWPQTTKFEMPVGLQIDCLPVNEGEEVILKINGNIEVPVFKEKKPFVVTNRRKTISRHPKDNSNHEVEKKQKFLVTELGRLYVVSRLHKDTHKVPLIGTYVQHSELPQLSITVPKNGLSSPATISFQVYPVASDLISQMQKQYPCILSMGPVCEVTHTDIEPLTRRLVNMTIPLPEDYKPRKTEGKLVIVSGTGDGAPIEVIEKSHISEAGAEFLTRLLTWKAAVTVSHIDMKILTDVCESMRKYTRKRMHFVKHLVMYKTGVYENTCEIALVIVTTGNEMALRNDWIGNGYCQARCIKELSQQMMCEGEITKLTIVGNPPIDMPVAFFSKQLSSRVIQLNLSINQPVRFQITNQQHQLVGEGEICA